VLLPVVTVAVVVEDSDEVVVGSVVTVVVMVTVIVAVDVVTVEVDVVVVEVCVVETVVVSISWQGASTSLVVGSLHSNENCSLQAFTQLSPSQDGTSTNPSNRGSQAAPLQHEHEQTP